MTVKVMSGPVRVVAPTLMVRLICTPVVFASSRSHPYPRRELDLHRRHPHLPPCRTGTSVPVVVRRDANGTLLLGVYLDSEHAADARVPGLKACLHPSLVPQTGIPCCLMRQLSAPAGAQTPVFARALTLGWTKLIYRSRSGR
jgi:hypothetical protein